MIGGEVMDEVSRAMALPFTVVKYSWLGWFLEDPDELHRIYSLLQS